MVINKNESKIQKYCVNRLLFSLKFVGIFFVSSIISSHIIIESLIKLATIFATACSRIPNTIFSTYMMFFPFPSTFVVIPIVIFHGICFVNIFDPFVPVIMLNTLRLKSSVSLVSHYLLDKSSRAL